MNVNSQFKFYFATSNFKRLFLMWLDVHLISADLKSKVISVPLSVGSQGFSPSSFAPTFHTSVDTLLCVCGLALTLVTCLCIILPKFTLRPSVQPMEPWCTWCQDEALKCYGWNFTVFCWKEVWRVKSSLATQSTQSPMRSYVSSLMSTSKKIPTTCHVDV